MSTERTPGVESEWVVGESSPVNPKRPDKKIHIGNARRSAIRLIKDLQGLGINVDKANMRISNLSMIEFPQQEHTSGFSKAVSISEIDIPTSGEPDLVRKMDLIRDSSMKVDWDNNYSIEIDMFLENQPFHMLIDVAPKREEHYKLNIVMPTTLGPNKEMLLEFLPAYFTHIGFTYDFLTNPQQREKLLSVARKRIPAEVLNLGSSVIGQQTPEGIDARMRLSLQDPDPQNYLKCYEVEIFLDGVKNSPNTPKVAPETIWQEEEKHYCMTEGDSYPFIPIELDALSTLAMTIDYQGNFPRALSDLLGDLPLSIDGSNQWYAKTADRKGSKGSLELLFKPEWGANNTKMVFRQSSQKRISPAEIQRTITDMIAFKNTLAEKIAA